MRYFEAFALAYLVGVVAYALMIGIPKLVRDFHHVRANMDNPDFWDDLDEPLLAWENLDWD